MRILVRPAGFEPAGNLSGHTPKLPDRFIMRDRTYSWSNWGRLHGVRRHGRPPAVNRLSLARARSHPRQPRGTTVRSHALETTPEMGKRAGHTDQQNHARGLLVEPMHDADIGTHQSAGAGQDQRPARSSRVSRSQRALAESIIRRVCQRSGCDDLRTRRATNTRRFPAVAGWDGTPRASPAQSRVLARYKSRQSRRSVRGAPPPAATRKCESLGYHLVQTQCHDQPIE